ncbi:hypothetical protein AMES_0473 [Amycolatopsis mediterranei S699]|uniref:DUF5667 domain-containing protein n=1 Tax=Amycolatopsis mediterranei (strain U-32) TaxID=749927 RepID=A0A0H3CW90_AMYMU|nr:DUF5667 domain-containing protein [Amycolatopsis mediterranei]ADJ42295.1 conserved hypothetical protein [Amycolatopsis mediterranei U32]AFO74009.1 hypothetical protein AMES_0473 [Amycolatopsis mediterranei S699]AGT81138.1 hypothetical protein B737_0474 [Amycolatopsis mediterranei RB]KDO09797.1 hypothetical protein DV26_17145 [Amycolatopsis mediterranei]KDU86329.1 hypothetical protein DV36_40420 [Amycolatopsis mediterranei]
MRFARERAESERFARALEPSPVRRDGEFADELALVGALRDLGAAGAPDLETRQRIRAEIAGRLETAAATTPRRRWRPRTADLVAAALFLFLVLSGLTLVLSRTALPGDPLYNVKRAGESTALGLTFGDQQKARKHLEFATNRITELGELAAEGANEADYRTAYDDFAADLQAGVAQMFAAATSDGNGTQALSDVRLWARNQAARLGAQPLPAGAAPVFGNVRDLLGKVQERASGLVARMNCYRITAGTSDELGPLPATGECTQRPLPSAGSQPTSASVSPSSQDSTAPTATGTQLPPSDAAATPGIPAPTGGVTPPPVFGQPPSTTSRPPVTTTTTPSPPLLSIPPLLPGLPPIVIG